VTPAGAWGSVDVPTLTLLFGLLVVSAALGVRIGWREHARVGVPVTLATLLVAAAWLAVR